MKKPAIEFKAIGDNLHLVYRPLDGTQRGYRKFKVDEHATVKGTFRLTRQILVNDDADEWTEIDGWEARTDADEFDFDEGGEDRTNFIIASVAQTNFSECSASIRVWDEIVSGRLLHFSFR
jgi:hypothetical protein